MNDEKILVVDDQERDLKKVEKILSEEYSLTLTTNAEEAIKKTKLASYQLVIIDMNLDGDKNSGIDLLIKMRKIVPGLRAIMLTNYNESSLAVASLQAGALDYITKAPLKILSPKLKDSINKHKRTDVIKVFLSYERKDQKKILNLYDKLTKQGFLPWMDKYDIGAGRWEPQIKRAINSSDFFIACLSPNSINKTGFIKKEFKFALEKQDEFDIDAAYIIPIRLVECDIPEALKEFHCVDLFRDTGFTDLAKMLLSKK